MTLNCKPGDLAVVVNSPVNGGRIVRCVSIATPGRNLLTARTGEVVRALVGESYWRIEGYTSCDVGPPSGAVRTVELPICPDENLRPLNPGDEPDETLTWAPVPGVLEVV